MEQVKITQLHIPFHQRIIIVSDLHADYDGFIQLLSKTQFTKDDLLIIVGDVIEKGKHSLKLLQTIIDLKKEAEMYVVSYVTELTELEGGQKLVRFYDPSGNLIEVRTPINYN